LSKAATSIERRHVREGVIDHLVEKAIPLAANTESTVQSPTTSTGLPVKEQVGKRRSLCQLLSGWPGVLNHWGRAGCAPPPPPSSSPVRRAV